MSGKFVGGPMDGQEHTGDRSCLFYVVPEPFPDGVEAAYPGDAIPSGHYMHEHRYVRRSFDGVEVLHYTGFKRRWVPALWTM